jgi:predicted TPR repeat methyltransferase
MYRYYLSALRGVDAPAQPPRQYVQSLFDQYADDFEPHLLHKLQYRGHSHLIEHLPHQTPAQFPRVLDLGCGTGLCGPLIRSRAGALWGIDLAQGMIDQSRRLGVYDRLEQAEATAFLASDASNWDLVLAADVFIYVGDLDNLLAQLARRMKPGGWLAFTAELTEPGHSGDQPHLQASLRYAHPLPYLERMAEAHGFVWHSHHDAPLRLDEGRALQARYAYWQRA